ncbi:hypothetical protein GGX14DRAFT_666283 [Mycena pura]|uniref:Uncharacterized protein n=1 Tax=Mycena pura TaxID=153505 RepID=A0AAD6Y2N5_9AGAR|nr:hypothetical protein GGX14DRAFT_666283 [Mycena pura]
MMADACNLLGRSRRRKGSTTSCVLRCRKDRLRVPVPASFKIHQSPHVLKQQFLRHLADLSKQIKPKDTLFIALCSHGRDTDGALVGNIELSKEYLTIAEVTAALCCKPSSTRTLTCFSGYWTREPASVWEVFAYHGQESQSIPATQRSLFLPPLFSHSLLARLTRYHISLTTPTFNKIATWVRLLGTPDFPTYVNAGVVLHALGQQAHLLFIADALHLTGAWSRSFAAVDKNVDLVKEFSNRLAIQHLWEVLQTIHDTGVVFRFLAAWHRAGYPQIDLEQVLDARAEVMVFMQRIGAENPELLCHCRQHLPLTDDEYEERVHQYRVDLLKETLLRMAQQVSETCSISMLELRSVASAVGVRGSPPYMPAPHSLQPPDDPHSHSACLPVPPHSFQYLHTPPVPLGSYPNFRSPSSKPVKGGSTGGHRKRACAGSSAACGIARQLPTCSREGAPARFRHRSVRGCRQRRGAACWTAVARCSMLDGAACWTARRGGNSAVWGQQHIAGASQASSGIKSETTQACVGGSAAWHIGGQWRGTLEGSHEHARAAARCGALEGGSAGALRAAAAAWYRGVAGGSSSGRQKKLRRLRCSAGG